MDKYTLHKDQKVDKWRLEKEGSNRAVKLFDRKADAIKGGALADAIGGKGGSVRIRKVDNTIQEERTITPAKDPHKSRG